MTNQEATRWADIIMILINDELQADMYKKDIEPNLSEGKMLMFAHGFAIHFGQIKAPAGVDVAMIARKKFGHTIKVHMDGQNCTWRTSGRAGDASERALIWLWHTALQSAVREQVF